MNLVNNLEYLSPDLYLRYIYGFEIIKNFQKDNPCRILDVGGKSGILGDLIKQEGLPYTLTVIDSLPDEKSKTTVCDKYIQQDFLKYKTDTKFDYLVTFDVFEHVKDRETFIKNCLSLSKNLVLTAPFQSNITNSAEVMVDNYFLRYKGTHHPWLREHFEQGLPKESWLRNFLDSQKIKYQVIESNNIENWVNFMLPNLLPALYTVDTQKLYQVNQYYNQNYQNLGDNTRPTYRKIFVTLPKGTFSIPGKLSSQKPEVNIRKKIIFINMIIDFLTDVIKNEKELNKLKDEKIIEDIKEEISQIKVDQKENFANLKSQKLLINSLENQYNQIINSRFFKIWQSYCKIRKFIK